MNMPWKDVDKGGIVDHLEHDAASDERVLNCGNVLQPQPAASNQALCLMLKTNKQTKPVEFSSGPINLEPVSFI